MNGRNLVAILLYLLFYNTYIGNKNSLDEVSLVWLTSRLLIFLCCVRKRNHIYLVLRVRGLFRLSSFRTCLLDLTFHLSGYFDDEKLTEVGKIHEDIESRLILPKETNLTVSVWASWKFTNESSLYIFCVLPLPLGVFKVDIRAFETLFRQDKKDIKKRPLICSGINRECTSVLWSWRTRNQGSDLTQYIPVSSLSLVTLHFTSSLFTPI